MNEMGIAGISPGPNLSKRNIHHQVHPYLLKGWNIAALNYAGALTSPTSGSPARWELAQSLELDFSVCAPGTPAGTAHIMHSDQGHHFKRPAYIGLLRTARMQVSMEGKGCATNNIFTKRLWGSVKYEEVCINEHSKPPASPTRHPELPQLL